MCVHSLYQSLMHFNRPMLLLYYYTVESLYCLLSLFYDPEMMINAFFAAVEEEGKQGPFSSPRATVQ